MQQYDLFAFGAMIGPRSKPRVDAYAAALRQSITPGCTVLDIGTGAGFFAILAARFGAGRVYGVDPNGAVDVAAELAAANGVADRITFIRGLSSDLELDEPADVIVSDIRGALPWYHRHIPSIVDARERLLAPGGVLIPGRDRVWAAVVEAPALYATYVAPWDGGAHGLDLSAARRRVTDSVRKVPAGELAPVGEPALMATLDYATVTDPDVRATLRWTVPRPATGHGVCAWFDTELVPGVGFSNAPKERRIPMYSQVLFPWRRAVALAAGDGVEVDFRARLNEHRYVWSWSTRVRSSGGEPKASFDQASFAAEIAVDA